MLAMNVLPLATLLAMMPLTLSAWKGSLRRDLVFWLLLAAAVSGPMAILGAELSLGWSPGLASFLWASILASLTAFAALSLADAPAYRLAALLLPYLFLLALAAWGFPGEAQIAVMPMAARSLPWFAVHLGLAISSYAFLTLAAIAGLAVLLQERALKSRKPSPWSQRVLPSLSEAARLQIRLLAGSALLMAAALVSGIANEWLEIGRLLVLTHKIIFTLLAFVFVISLLVIHYRTGERGRLAARLILSGYLLLTLAGPGVKFVRQVLIDG